MENKYREALKSLKKPSDKPYEAFKTPWNYKEFTLVPRGKIEPLEKSSAADVAESGANQEAPLKKEVLDSFTGFAKDQLSQDEKIAFKGGEIKNRESDYSFEFLSTELAQLQQLAKDQLGEGLAKLHYHQKNPDEVRLLFISDSFLDQSFNAETALSDYYCCFEPAVSELFSKMVAAMKLQASEVLITAISDESGEKELGELVLKEISYFKPEFLVTLGAGATGHFIGADKKLRNHHGQLFQLKFKAGDDILHEAALMPLFSPKLLNIAPNMKKTAWEDMQKLMQKL